jgi:hypothetical protein
VLDDGEQAAFAQRPVEAPTVDTLNAFENECLRVRQEIISEGAKASRSKCVRTAPMAAENDG